MILQSEYSSKGVLDKTGKQFGEQLQKANNIKLSKTTHNPSTGLRTPRPPFVEDMSVDHYRAEILVAQPASVGLTALARREERRFVGMGGTKRVACG
jgi:hypothetical protein